MVWFSIFPCYIPRMRPLSLVLLTACAPASLGVPASVPELIVPATLEIGPVPLDRSGVATLTLQNAGDAPLTLSGSVSGLGFSLLDGATSAVWSLDPGASLSLRLRFTPPDAEPQDGALVLEPDPDQLFEADRGALTVALLGTPDLDADDDGHPHIAAGGDDCDDQDASAYPGATERWYDGADQDCDGRDDDQDQDGYGYLDDCDDLDPSRSPAASDADLDGLDTDCDGLVDQDAVRALAGGLVITEWLARSVVIASEDGTWLEIANVSGADVSLDGWRLGDEALAGTLDGPSSLRAGGLLLVCAETSPLQNGGLACDATVSPWPTLGDGLLALYAPIYTDQGVEAERVLIDAVAPDGTWPSAAGRSTQLDPESWTAADNDAADSWCLSPAGDEEADQGTPDEANTTCE